MRKFFMPAGIVFTILGSTVLVIALKARSLADSVLASLTNEDDLLFEASNRPSISVWEGYRATGIRIAIIIGAAMLSLGLVLTIWQSVRNIRSISREATVPEDAAGV